MRLLLTAGAALAISFAGLASSSADPDAAEHAVLLRLDPRTGALEMRDTVTGAGAAMVLDGADWLGTIAARVGDEAIVAESVGAATAFRLPDAGEAVTVTAEGVVPPSTGAPEAAGTSPDGAFLLDPTVWLPRAAVGADAYTLTVETRAPYRAVATGALVSEEEAADGTARATFRFEAHDEAPVVLVGPYLIDERIVGDLRLRTYFPQESRPYAEAYLDAAQGYIARYAEGIGPYPYDGFAVVAAPIPVGLGFPRLTYVAQSILEHPYMRGRSLAHEILHTWWGNAVGVDYGAGNWAEGLTTFQADYALAAEDSPEAARAMRLEWLADLAALPERAREPIVDFRTSAHGGGGQAVGYGKLALVFRMLEEKLGSEIFARGLQALYAEHRFGRAGWADVRAAFDEASGRDLGWFFAQWLERAGEPRIALAAAEPLPDGGGVTFTLTQDAPAYRLPVPVRIETEAGPIETQVTLEDATQTFRMETPAAARALQVDPDYRLVRALLEGETAPTLRDALQASEIALVTPSPALSHGEAEALVRQLVGSEPALDPTTAQALGDGPAIVIGLTEDVARLASTVAPARVGEARAWIAPEGPPRVFVSADDPEALAEVVPRLRFYAKQSLVAFENGETSRREVWSVGESPLSARF